MSDNDNKEAIEWIRSLDIEISDNPTKDELSAAIHKGIHKSMNESVFFGGHRLLNTNPFPKTGRPIVRHIPKPS